MPQPAATPGPAPDGLVSHFRAAPQAVPLDAPHERGEAAVLSRAITYTYTYDHANRLTSATWGTRTYTFTYNGLGDRLRQTVAGTPTSYTLDLVGGLTGVLSDGVNAYVYGDGRIGEDQASGWVYHLGDALGSVRQLASASASVTLARSHEPFGDTRSSAGTGTSIFQFTGQQVDGTELLFLRARYYEPPYGRFLSRDVWGGDPNQPMSYNWWLYVLANPVNSVDPSGLVREDEAQRAANILRMLQGRLGVRIVQDWGYSYWPVAGPLSRRFCRWDEGEWSLDELRIVYFGLFDLAKAMQGDQQFVANIGGATVRQAELPNFVGGHTFGHSVTFPSTTSFGMWNVVHEFGHVWDNNREGRLSRGLEIYTGGYTSLEAAHERQSRQGFCDPEHRYPGCNTAGYYYRGIPAHGSDVNFDRREDFAESVTAYVYPITAQMEVAPWGRGTSPYRMLLFFTNYRATERWEYIDGLIRGTVNPLAIGP